MKLIVFTIKQTETLTDIGESHVSLRMREQHVVCKLLFCHSPAVILDQEKNLLLLLRNRDGEKAVFPGMGKAMEDGIFVSA